MKEKVKYKTTVIYFKNKKYKIELQKLNKILSKILQKDITVDNENDLKIILKKHKLLDEVFLDFISI
jgi:hypothetical protein